MFRFILFALLAAVSVSAQDYNFFMISDPHFGAAKTYCTDPKIPRQYRTKKDISRADKVMPLYEACFAHLAAKADSRSRFVIEGGDLIEGGTHNEAAHKQVLTDALALMRKHFKKLPIYMVKGNHEAFGMGGAAAYKSVLLPEIAKYANKKKLNYANYAVTCGKDLFIFIDFYPQARGFEFARKILTGLKTKPRYVFLTLHCPMMPTWQFTKDAYPICELLSRYNGILLAGHCHANAVTRFEKNGKSMTQVTVSTFITRAPVEKQRMMDSQTNARKMKEQFRKRVQKRAPQFLPVFDKKWAPCIVDYKHFKGSGYAQFHVSDRGVAVSFQSIDLTQKPITVQLISRVKNK